MSCIELWGCWTYYLKSKGSKAHSEIDGVKSIIHRRYELKSILSKRWGLKGVLRKQLCQKQCIKEIEVKQRALSRRWEAQKCTQKVIMLKAISKKDRDKTVHYLVGEGSKAL